MGTLGIEPRQDTRYKQAALPLSYAPTKTIIRHKSQIVKLLGGDPCN